MIIEVRDPKNGRTVELTAAQFRRYLARHGYPWHKRIRILAGCFRDGLRAS